MPDPTDVLTDDELLSLPNGHPLLGKLTSEEAQRRTRLQTGQPGGDAATRQDTGILGINRQWLNDKIANAPLDPTFQKPAAMGAANIVASLIEMLGAPESVVSMGGASALRGASKLAAGAKGVAKPAAQLAGDITADVGHALLPRTTRTAGRIYDSIKARLGSMPAPQGARLAKKGPALNDALSDAVNAARAPQPPKSVSLPGGDTVRATGPVPPVSPSGPRLGAYSSDAPPAVASGAPPAAAPPAPARSTPAPKATPEPGVRLTSEEAQALKQFVAEGYDEADVVKAILKERQAAPPKAAPSGKPSLSAAETKEYTRLLRSGKSPKDAMDLIESQRAMTSRMGLPSSEDARLKVSDRNATGRWRE